MLGVENIVVKATVYILQLYCVFLEFIVVRETVYIVQWFSVVCREFCG